MLESCLEEYVNELYERQNIGATIEQRNLYTRREYYELLKPVVELIKNHSSYSLDEMRDYLFKESRIEELLKNFIYKREITPGMVFSYGTKNYRETVVIGNSQEVSLDENGNLVPDIKKMTEDTIFDLASITKLFTSISILKLIQEGKIKLTDKVIKYMPELSNLKDVTIFDLLSFRVPLSTVGRIDDAKTLEGAKEILKTMYINDKFPVNANPYSDMGAIVLKYVIENASGQRYYDYVCEWSKEIGLSDTHASIPHYKLDRVASTNFETHIFADGKIVNHNYHLGEVNDPKARILKIQDNSTGHAGLFSTVSDMTKLARGIMGGQIIDKYYVEMMAENKTGRKYIEEEQEKYVQYLGFLCYSKNPVLSSSEVFHALSGRSFASAGWAGNQLTIDPINELFFFMASNRTHNRVSRVLSSEYRDNAIVDSNGKKAIILPNGEIKIDSSRFAWDRDEFVVHPALKLSIQYKFLEDIYILMNERIENKEQVKSL